MKPKNFSEDYTEDGFWAKVASFGKRAGSELVEKVLTLYFSLKDSDTPVWAKTVIVGALGYFVAPVDAIPDIVPIAGFADDLGVIVAALGTVAVHIKAAHISAARAKVREWFGGEDVE